MHSMEWAWSLGSDMESRCGAACNARRVWREWAASHLPRGVLSDLEIVLGEAAVNAAKHSGSADLEIVSLCSASSALLVVRDSGCGFAVHSVGHPGAQAISGRGIQLMKGLASVDIESDETGTTVTAWRVWHGRFEGP